MTLSNKIYDILKAIAQYILPALATCYFTLAQSGFDLPYVNEIVGVVTAFDTLLGVILGIAKSNYSGEGTIVVDSKAEEEEGVKTFVLDIPLTDLVDRKSITMMVEDEANG